jgi:biopolymer transport protein ExbB
VSILALVALLVILGPVQGALAQQESAAQTEAVASEPASVPATDSLAMAPNDSAAVKQEIDAIIKKEQSKFVNRIKRTGIGQLYVKGGFFMHFLLLSSIVGLVFIIERAWTLFRARTNVKAFMAEVIRALREGGVEAALRVCERTRGPIAAIIHSGLLRADRGAEAVEKAISTAGTIEMSFLERGLVALATVGNVAPLLGFLGTVSGMISAFAAIAAAEQVSAKLVAKGIEEALITTATGLIIAIPANVAHNFFVSVIDRFIIEMEEASAELINEIMELEVRAKQQA